MKITKTDNGYILEEPQTSNEAQALEQFVESLRKGNEIVEVSDRSAIVTKIMAEIYKAMEKLGARSDLLGTVGSFGDTLSDEDVLEFLREWNKSMEPSSDDSKEEGGSPAQEPRKDGLKFVDLVTPCAKKQIEEIEIFLEFYQSQGLLHSKALELALKSVGIDCEITGSHLAKS